MAAARYTVVAHPLLQVRLAALRNRDTDPETFRRHLREAARLLAFGATQTLSVEPCVVETPLRSAEGHRLAAPVILVPILRAGLALLDAFLESIPDARVGHLGMARNESTLQPEWYYTKTPALAEAAQVIVLDPMLATGGSAEAALTALTERGARRLTFVSLLATLVGIDRVLSAHPNVHIFTGAIDPELNSDGFIVPGLGDAGDRYFGTQ